MRQRNHAPTTTFLRERPCRWTVSEYDESLCVHQEIRRPPTVVEDKEGESIAWGTTQKGQVRNGTERENFCERGHEGRPGREASKLPTQSENCGGGSGFGSSQKVRRRDEERDVTCES